VAILITSIAVPAAITHVDARTPAEFTTPPTNLRSSAPDAKCCHRTRLAAAIAKDTDLALKELTIQGDLSASREAERLGSDQAAAESVKKKYLNEVCGPAKDTRLFMGTVFPYNTWVVIGVYWPPKIKQP
jgi:hypothetical protein